VKPRAAPLLFLVSLSAVLPLAKQLSAEPPTLVGRWQAGPLVARWRIGEWAKACGPEPSGGGDGGGMVVVTQNGRELVFTGLSRTFSTTGCWQLVPGAAPTTHSASVRAWQTTCQTNAANPRQTTLRTRVSATDTSISFEETGQYQFMVEGQNCTASSGHWRTFSLVQRAGDPAPSATPGSAPGSPPPALSAAPVPSKPHSSDRCRVLGVPARLEVRPQLKLLQPGDKFTFRAQVLDEKGCLHSAKPSWSLVAGMNDAQISNNGELSIKPEVAQSEITVRAEIGTTHVEVKAQVTAKENYDALLKSGAFDPSGEVPEAAGRDITGASLGVKGVITEDDSKSRKRWFVGLVTLVALLLGAGGVALTLRTRALHRKRARASQEATSKSVPASVRPAAPKQVVCPVCGGLYPATMKFCTKDGTVLLPIN